MIDNRKTRYTKMILHDSLMELMQKKNISAISIKDLCETADINRTTFYYHYEDVYDLLHKIEDSALSHIEELHLLINERSEKKQFLKLLETFLQYIYENKKTMQVLMSERGEVDFQRRIIMMTYRKFDLDYGSKRAIDAETAEYHLSYIVNGSIGIIQHWMEHGFSKTVKEVAQILLSCCSHEQIT